LSGYVGVDLILGNAADGSKDIAIEINPRLTTSYVGLRALARFNLAEAMLALALGQQLPEITWHSGIVRFLADGTVHRLPVQ
jgi:predicted ATP-grasp superfamily ATP-dependent carboligase